MENKETLEEAADMDSKNHYKDQSDYWAIGFDSFKRGAKWQQERMYSEEDLEEAFKAGREGDMVFNNESPKYWDFKEWFEQFKKK
jgi:hypothetical protein